MSTIEFMYTLHIIIYITKCYMRMKQQQKEKTTNQFVGHLLMVNNFIFISRLNKIKSYFKKNGNKNNIVCDMLMMDEKEYKKNECE